MNFRFGLIFDVKKRTGIKPWPEDVERQFLLVTEGKRAEVEALLTRKVYQVGGARGIPDDATFLAQAKDFRKRYLDMSDHLGEFNMDEEPTCIRYELIDGELVARYNYSVAPPSEFFALIGLSEEDSDAFDMHLSVVWNRNYTYPMSLKDLIEFEARANGQSTDLVAHNRNQRFPIEIAWSAKWRGTDISGEDDVVPPGEDRTIATKPGGTTDDYADMKVESAVVHGPR